MLWKGMGGRGLAGAAVGSDGGGVSPAVKVDCSVDEGDRTSAG